MSLNLVDVSPAHLAAFQPARRVWLSLAPSVKKNKKMLTRRDQTFHCEGETGERGARGWGWGGFAEKE